MSRGTQFVSSGGVVSGTIVSGQQDIFASATAIGTVVYASAEFVNGIAIGTILSGGQQVVSSGGVASGKHFAYVSPINKFVNHGARYGVVAYQLETCC